MRRPIGNITIDTDQMQRQIKNHDERRRIVKLIERSLKQDLTPSEHSIVGFIADRTLRFNKFWERITVDQICHGIRTRDGLWVHRGIKISERQAHRLLSNLLKDQIILRKSIPWSTQTTYEYALNIENSMFIGQSMMDSDNATAQSDDDS